MNNPAAEIAEWRHRQFSALWMRPGRYAFGALSGPSAGHRQITWRGHKYAGCQVSIGEGEESHCAIVAGCFAPAAASAGAPAGASAAEHMAPKTVSRQVSRRARRGPVSPVQLRRRRADNPTTPTQRARIRAQVLDSGTAESTGTADAVSTDCTSDRLTKT